MKEWEDAFGHEVMDFFQGKGGYEIVEREDGFFSITPGPQLYFSEYRQWMEHEKEAMEYVKGRVLDIGCGAGRHALYLQERGFWVMGVDASPLAVEVCRRRGLKRVEVLSITRLSSRLGKFDTLLLMGGNFGLLGSLKRARWLLRRFRKMTNPGAVIIADSLDPYYLDLPEHEEYREMNRKRGRMPGQLRIRLRYRRFVSPWFDYLLVSQEEMATVLEGTGWKVRRFLEGEHGVYVGIIERE